jgi:hypothetical protein
VRIGTWNLGGRWGGGHRRLMLDADCQVWLLTGVPETFDLVGTLAPSAEMPVHGERRLWAAVWSPDPLTALASPHRAAALARQGDLLLCSCVLPWRGAAHIWPDAGDTTAERTIAALDRLRTGIETPDHRLVWGGDWNHGMDGPETSGSLESRAAIRGTAEWLGLKIPTADLPHHHDGLLSIDHIAVPWWWEIREARRIPALAGGRRLSDHDAYVVETV